jgi:uncharacterized membrane protein YphA (DoxX/SURF4 family)
MILRIAIGILFIVSGFEKIISPYQNFLYVIQAYELIPSPMDHWVAIVFPWIEFFVGVFVLLGLWLKVALRGAVVLFLTFILVVTQALIRHLPIDECGCFGQLISFPLHVVLIMDSVMLMSTLWLIVQINKDNFFSLDKYFRQ